MKIFTEKEAEEFLEKEDFKIIQRKYITHKSEIKKIVNKIGFPIVLKVSGKKIVHKNKLGGVKTNIQNYEQALKAFNEIKKIKNFEQAIIQKQIEGEEFLLGIKKTPEFGHACAFGAGGVHTEKLKDISFRICSFNKNEAKKMIQEVKMAQNLNKKNTNIIIKNLLKLCKLVKKYPKIKELDINPLIVTTKSAIIVDARIVWE
ncbi:acetate--CoA ligase family protein [Candidatus Pacearchaeota archaeon]|nr:acetate--CoA ligase family protein [Candidatus Pacearchaeota archaeon]